MPQLVTQVKPSIDFTRRRVVQIVAVTGALALFGGIFGVKQSLEEYDLYCKKIKQIERDKKRVLTTNQQRKKFKIYDKDGFLVKGPPRGSKNKSLKWQGIDEQGDFTGPVWQIFEVPSIGPRLEDDPHYIKVYYNLDAQPIYSTAIYLNNSGIKEPYNVKCVKEETLYRVFYTQSDRAWNDGYRAVYAYDISYLGKKKSDFDIIMNQINQKLDSWPSHLHLKEINLYQHGQGVYLFKNQFTEETLEGTWWKRWKAHRYNNSLIGKLLSGKFTSQLKYSISTDNGKITIQLTKPPFMKMRLSNDKSTIHVSFHPDEEGKLPSVYSDKFSVGLFCTKEVVDVSLVGEDGKLEQKTQVSSEQALTIFAKLGSVFAVVALLSQLIKGYSGRKQKKTKDSVKEVQKDQSSLSEDNDKNFYETKNWVRRVWISWKYIFGSMGITSVLFGCFNIHALTIVAGVFAVYFMITSPINYVLSNRRIALHKKIDEIVGPMNVASKAERSEKIYYANQDSERLNEMIKDGVKLGLLSLMLGMQYFFGVFHSIAVFNIVGLVGMYVLKFGFRAYQRKMHPEEYGERKIHLEKNPLLVRIAKLRTLITARIKVWENELKQTKDEEYKKIVQARIDFWKRKMESEDDPQLCKEFLELTRLFEQYTAKLLGGKAHVTYLMNYLVIHYPEFLTNELQKKEVNKRVKILYFLIQTELDEFGLEADVKKSTSDPEEDYPPKDQVKVEVINKVYRYLLEEQSGKSNKPLTDEFVFKGIFNKLDSDYSTKDTSWADTFGRMETNVSEQHQVFEWDQGSEKPKAIRAQYEDLLVGEGLTSLKSRLLLLYRAYKREHTIPILPYRISVGVWNLCMFLWPFFGAFGWIAGVGAKESVWKQNPLLYTARNIGGSVVLGAVIGAVALGIGYGMTGTIAIALSAVVTGSLMGAGLGVVFGITLSVAVHFSPYLKKFVTTSPVVDKEKYSEHYQKTMKWRVSFENIVMHGMAIVALVVNGVFAVMTYIGAGSISAPPMLAIMFSPLILLALFPLTYLSIRLLTNTFISHWTAKEKILSKVRTKDDILFYFKECMLTIEKEWEPLVAREGDSKNPVYRRMIEELYDRGELSPDEYEIMKEAENTHYLRKLPKSDEALRQIKQFMSKAYMGRFIPRSIKEVEGFTVILPCAKEACEYYFREIACSPLKEGEARTPLGQMAKNYPVEWSNYLHQLLSKNEINEKGMDFLLTIPKNTPLSIEEMQGHVDKKNISNAAIQKIEKWFNVRQMYVSHTMDSLQNYYQVYEDIGKYKLGMTQEDAEAFANYKVQIILKHDWASKFYNWQNPEEITPFMELAKASFSKIVQAHPEELKEYENMKLLPVEFAKKVYELQKDYPFINFTLFRELNDNLEKFKIKEKEVPSVEQAFRMVGYFARYQGAGITSYTPKGSEEKLFDVDRSVYGIKYAGDSEMTKVENISYQGKSANVRDIAHIVGENDIPMCSVRGIQLISVSGKQMLRGSKLGGMSNALGLTIHPYGQMTDADTDTRYAEIVDVPSEYYRMSKQPYIGILLNTLHVFNERYSSATRVFAFAENVWAKNVQRSMRQHRSLLGYGKFSYINWNYVRMFSGMEADDVVSEDSAQVSAMKAEGLEVDHSELIAMRQGFEVTYAQATAPLNKYPAGTVELLLRNILPDLADESFSMAQRIATIEAPMHYYKKIFVGWAMQAVMILGFLLPFMPMRDAGILMVVVGFIFAQSVNFNGLLYFVERYGNVKGIWESMKIMLPATAYFTPFISAYALAVKRGLEAWAKFVTSAKTVAIQQEPLLNIITRDYSSSNMGSLMLLIIGLAPFGIKSFIAFSPLIILAVLMTFGRIATNVLKTPWRNLVQHTCSAVANSFTWELNKVQQPEKSVGHVFDPNLIGWGRYGHAVLGLSGVVSGVGIFCAIPLTVTLSAIFVFLLSGAFVHDYLDILPNRFMGKSDLLSAGFNVGVHLLNLVFAFPQLVHKIIFLGLYMVFQTVGYILAGLGFRVLIDCGAWVTVPAILFVTGLSSPVTCAVTLGAILIGGLTGVFVLTAHINKMPKESGRFRTFLTGIRDVITTFGLGITPLRIIGLFHNNFATTVQIALLSGAFFGSTLFLLYPLKAVSIPIFGVLFPLGGYVFGILGVFALPFIPIILTAVILTLPKIIMMPMKYKVLEKNIASRGVGRIIHYVNDLTLEAGKSTLTSRVKKFPKFMTKAYTDLLMTNKDAVKQQAKEHQEQQIEKHLLEIIAPTTPEIIPITPVHSICTLLKHSIKSSFRIKRSA